MDQPSEVEQRYREAKAHREQLEHAKVVSDRIGALVGIPPPGHYHHVPIEFPGLSDARREEAEALEAWGKEGT